MGAAEIVLIVIGGVVLVLSYVLPSQKGRMDEAAPQINEGQIKDLVEKEIKNAKTHINDIVEETVTYSMEKTERAMERLTNEKIMAVKEYSDLVLDNINKSHNEVVFLYDMLNDKHKNLVTMVGEAAKAAKEIQETVKAAETNTEAGDISAAEEGSREPAAETEPVEFIPIMPKRVELKHSITETEAHQAPEEEKVNDEEAIQEEKSGNNNEKILRLHKLGKSSTAIAKELGLGVGEVKLVIGLYE